MTVFWMITAAMIVAALAMLAPTLVRRPKDDLDDTEQINVGIAREHLDALIRQKDAGELSDEEFAQGRKDLELALAQDLEAGAGANPERHTAGGRLALLAIVLIIPAITIPLYLEIGSPGLIAAPAGTPAVAGSDTRQLPPMDELARQLRERLEADPGNAEGWFLLGRTYMRLEAYTQAAEAYERVVALMPNEVAGMLSAADALTMRDGRRSPPRAIELLEKALSIEPDSITALWLLGNARFQQGDTEQALEFWLRAHPLLDAEPQMQTELAGMIRQAGGTVPATARSLPQIMTAAASSPTAGQIPAADAPATPDPTGGTAIRVQVAMAPELMDRAAPGDTVFVLARAESGPPMPLAVARHRVDELPLDVTLTDAMAMMPAMKLSSFPRVRVSARISKSGQAGSQPGDLAAGDIVVDSATPPEAVQLLINEVVQ